MASPKDRVKNTARDLTIAATGCVVGAFFDWFIKLF
jgi:hypothetical protein